MKKRIITALVLSMLGVSLLSGCNKTVNEKNRQYNVDFSWWGNDNRHKYTMNGINDFMDNNENINVVFHYGEWSGYERKNRVWMNSKTEADVMQINYAWLDEYSKDGNGYYNLYELADYIDLSQYEEDELSYGVKNGKLNAIPIAFNMSTLCYNKAIFDKYNLECPKTWDDLFTAAQVLSEDDIYTLGMSKKHMMLMLIAYFEQTTGRSAFDKDGKLLLTKDDIGYILDFYKELIEKKVLKPIDQFDKSNLADGQVAMGIFWISDADSYCKGIADGGGEAVITDYFMADNATLSGLYMKPATMYAISNISENPEEAAKLLDYLLNNENMILLQGTEKGVPVSKKAVETLKKDNKLDGYGYEAYSNMQQHRDELNIMIPIMESEEIIDVFKEDADEYIYDVTNREETINNIYDDMWVIINK